VTNEGDGDISSGSGDTIGFKCGCQCEAPIGCSENLIFLFYLFVS
jgi:hypothetical protein